MNEPLLVSSSIFAGPEKTVDSSISSSFQRVNTCFLGFPIISSLNDASRQQNLDIHS